jgi:capsular exopolysaccharide synthesis family protein
MPYYAILYDKSHMKFSIPENLKQRLLKVVTASEYVIPHAKTPEGIDGRIVVCSDKDSYVAEQYKVLRTNLYSLSPGNPVKTLVITSSQPAEGKTTTSCNLAFALSLDNEKKILLVDSDFRKPDIHNIFNMERKPGFSDILNSDGVLLETMLKKPAAGNLFIIPAGSIKTNPSEILISTKIKNIIDKLRLKFDYIIFDTPPVLSVTDACILGSLCDAVILIVRADVTQKRMIEEAYNMLTGAQAKPKGCILTGVHHLLDSYYYYYKYKYYRYTADK